MVNVSLLKKICLTPGAPGYEQRIRELVIQEVTPLVDEVSIDAMGSVIALKKGKNDKRVMVAAHIDEIGFMVTYIDKNGFIRSRLDAFGNPKIFYKGIISEQEKMDEDGNEQEISMLKEDIKKLLNE